MATPREVSLGDTQMSGDRFLVLRDDGVVCTAHTNRNGETVDVRPLPAPTTYDKLVRLAVTDAYGGEWPLTRRAARREEYDTQLDEITYNFTVDVDGVPIVVGTLTSFEHVELYPRYSAALAREVARHQQDAVEEARWEAFLTDPRITNTERGRFARKRGNAAQWLLERRGIPWTPERERVVRALVKEEESYVLKGC